MAVTEHDVRHAASLARLTIPEDRLPWLVAELNGILYHMEALRRVDTTEAQPVHGVGAGGMRLRDDDGEPYSLARPLESFAPAVRDGFVVVPRLDAHGAALGTGGEANPEAHT